MFFSILPRIFKILFSEVSFKIKNIKYTEEVIFIYLLGISIKLNCISEIKWL